MNIGLPSPKIVGRLVRIRPLLRTAPRSVMWLPPSMSPLCDHIRFVAYKNVLLFIIWCCPHAYVDAYNVLLLIIKYGLHVVVYNIFFKVICCKADIYTRGYLFTLLGDGIGKNCTLWRVWARVTGKIGFVLTHTLRVTSLYMRDVAMNIKEDIE
jgi:hypothetical protein